MLKQYLCSCVETICASSTCGPLLQLLLYPKSPRIQLLITLHIQITQCLGLKTKITISNCSVHVASWAAVIISLYTDQNLSPHPNAILTSAQNELRKFLHIIT
jgi:hypothetical protein